MLSIVGRKKTVQITIFGGKSLPKYNNFSNFYIINYYNPE